MFETVGNELLGPVSFGSPGEYELCMIVYRSTPTGEECKEKFTKNIEVKGNIPPPIVMPNPAVNNIVMMFSGQGNKPVSIGLIDREGRLVIKAESIIRADGSVDLNVENAATGLYIIKMETNKGVWFEKVLIIK